MKFDPIKIASSVTMATNATSSGVYIDQLLAYSIQAVWTGKPVGTLNVQVSNDIVNVDPTISDPAYSVTNWTTYTNGALSLTGSGSAGTYLWNSPISGYAWVRLQYQQSSGSGTLSATFAGKG